MWIPIPDPDPNPKIPIPNPMLCTLYSLFSFESKRKQEQVSMYVCINVESWHIARERPAAPQG
jgi:hypothetical protein